MGSIPYCDHHGWNWEPGQGPSPCMGETASFLLASSVLLYTIPLTKDTLQPFRRAAAAGSTAARFHAVQISLAIVQAPIALLCGVLFVRPRGMLSGANLLYSMSWTAASCTMAVALQRHPDCSKTLIWFWCGALVVNSVVLSSLRHASEVSGHRLPAEIGCLSWMSFFANAVLVVLQLFKPELDDTEGVYVRVVGREGVVPSASSGNNGWQAFWAGSGDTFDVAATAVSGEGRSTKSGSSSSSSRWCCFGGQRAGGDDFEGGGAWPTAGGTNGGGGGTLNESLLGTIGLDDQEGGVSSPSKPKAGWNNGGGGSSQGRARAGGCFRRVGGLLSSAVDRGNKAASAAAEQEEGRAGGGVGASWLQRQDSPFRRKLWGDGGSASATTVSGASTQSGLGAGSSSSSSPPSYSGAASIGVRAPPQVAAPIFGVAVTRWRLVDLDGEPLGHGSSSGDVAWTDCSRSASSSSARTATTLSASDATLAGVGGGGGGRASSMVESRFNDHVDPPLALDPNDGARAGEPLRVQFELVVRASGRGEMDWWGRGDSAEPGSPGAGHIGIHPPHGPASTTPGGGDWRVWRSAADTLALYDALALRFGQEFCGRVSRPKLKTTLSSSVAGASGVLSDDRSGSSPRPYSPDSPPALIVAPAVPHRVDILRDAKTVGAFLRSLLGLRQFLSTAVMDYLAQPAPASLPADDLSANGGGGADAGSNHGSDGYFTSDDLLLNDDDERGSRHTTASTSSHHRRPFSSGKADGGSGPSAAGQAVAGAALASDYGTWLKRLAVRLRRATPAGKRFVRLRCISPAVTGEQVVRWLMREKVCNGDRASAVRLGQDMVSHRLLAPVCAGYHRPEEEVTGGRDDSSSGKEQGGLLRSFDDAVGWLFAFVGDALRDPFAPPPPTQVAVMSNTGVDVRVTGWTETSDDDGAHVSFVVHTRIEPTQEAWESPRRYREFTQLRKRLLRLGIDIPAAAAAAVARNGDDGGGGGGGGGGGLAPGLPRKTWRANKFHKEHLEKRRAALEAYLQAAVKEALSAPHLSGHLMMRFLDPDESNLRILSEQQRQQQRSRNPFARAHNSPPCSPRRGTPGGRCGAGGGALAVTADVANESMGESLTEERTEAEDFDFLTDSLGGFG